MPYFYFFDRLWVLFQSLDKKNRVRFVVYYNLVIVAQRVDMVLSIFKDVKSLKEQFDFRCTNEMIQKLLRLLHDALVHNKHR